MLTSGKNIELLTQHHNNFSHQSVRDFVNLFKFINQIKEDNPSIKVNELLKSFVDGFISAKDVYSELSELVFNHQK